MSGHEASPSFEQVFGRPPEYVVRSPGRVNLIGDHTDYTGGLVLPIAIDRAVIVAARPTEEAFVDVRSAHFRERVRIELDEMTADPAPAWSRYAVGVMAMLKRRGIKLRGAQLWIGGDLPPGAGLASSAAIEVGIALAMLTAAESLSRNWFTDEYDRLGSRSHSGLGMGTRMNPPPDELASLCRQAEHEFADSPCGIMDQLCCTSARSGHALLIDCQTAKTQAVPLNLGNTELIVVDTGVRHSIAGAEYAARRRECTLALEAIRRADPSITSLREMILDGLESFADALGDTLFQRVTHVVTENSRVARAAEALRASDLHTFGRLMTESHASLRDNFAVSCPELDTVVSIARSVDGVYGARMTGGGFGGCAIALAHADAVDTLRSAIRESYNSQYATRATVFTVRSTDAARVE